MAIVLPKFSRRRAPAGLADQTQPALNVCLCRDDGRYPATGLLRATWRIGRVPRERLQCVEISVLWHTEGKGDEDLNVHHFERLNDVDLAGIDVQQPRLLECQLPATPLSYHGTLLSIVWCLRVRIFLIDGKEVVAEQLFHVVAAGSESAEPPATRQDAAGSASPPIDADPAPTPTFVSRLRPRWMTGRLVKQ